MFSKISKKAAAFVAAAVIALSGGGVAAYAATTQPSPGAAETTVYACEGAAGQFDYYEFRTPVPHKCYYPGETLVGYQAVELAQGAQFPIAVTVGTAPAGQVGTETLTGECTVEPLADGSVSRLGLSCTTGAPVTATAAATP